MTDPNMDTIERKAKAYSEARDALAKVVSATAEEVVAAKKKNLPEIRILHGIKVGFVKQKGKITFGDASSVVKLIRRHLSDRFDELVKVAETPVKPALGRLSGAELKKIGVTVGSDTDQVVVSPVDSEVDRIVDALLDGARDDEKEEQS